MIRLSSKVCSSLVVVYKYMTELMRISRDDCLHWSLTMRYFTKVDKPGFIYLGTIKDFC